MGQKQGKSKYTRQKKLTMNTSQLLKDFFKGTSYKFERFIEENEFQYIVQAKSSEHQCLVAVKIFKYMNNLQCLEAYEFEKSTLMKTKNERYALQLLDCLQNLEINMSGIVIEFCDCSLSAVSSLNAFSFQQVLALTYQLIRGLQVLQQHGIFLKDVNSDNILYSWRKNKFIIANFSKQQMQLETSLLQEEKNDDVFSIGRILIEVFLQRSLQPLECNNLKTQFILEAIPELVNHQHINFVKDILANMVNPNQKEIFQPVQLLHTLNNYLVDELCLQSLILPALSSENSVQTLKKIKIENFNDLNKIKEYQDISINLQNYNIFSKEAKTIAEHIEKCSSVSKLTLNLLGNYIFAGGAKKIGSSLEKCENLAYLNLNLQGNHIQPEGAKNIGSSLEKCLNLCSLNLNLVLNELGVEGARNIGLCLEKCQGLHELHLNLLGNYIGSEGAKYIGNSLEKCQNITHLDLNLQSNYLFVEGTKSIGMSLQRCQNITNLNLNLQLNELGVEGTKYIAQSLEKCQNIQFLSLNLWRNYISSEGIKSLGKSLEKCQNITSLNLNLQLNEICDEGAKGFRKSLQNCQNITSLFLSLQSNQINQDGVKNIRYLSKKCSKLVEAAFYF
ncbi:kinase domain protein (macronuclear) [Tetrahymena thermophila SB210]|uniref:Kinase domain protein n=1 Tax=Tetrahymena thermophila (strain SB210) TaxID=312017 RepID=Q22G23_TETTS|nr:kinase domain protein [Tetrahymena thermophila SB210]EAR84203.2 kinase domain protein [Tetrahymena thermophila SB210]|eukprot:XP_001031866.2 kinase domain protein [Tetrahymena thermophila SB210]